MGEARTRPAQAEARSGLDWQVGALLLLIIIIFIIVIIMMIITTITISSMEGKAS